MYSRGSLVIQVREEGRIGAQKLSLSPMKLLGRARKAFSRFIFSLPRRWRTDSDRNSVGQSVATKAFHSPYHYSSISHRNEAIADCVEFFNQSFKSGAGNSHEGSDMV